MGQLPLQLQELVSAGAQRHAEEADEVGAPTARDKQQR